MVGNCYYLTVWADAYQGITESNENNNCYDGDVYIDYINKGCSGNSCTSSTQKVKQQDCSYGCSGGSCNSAPQSCTNECSYSGQMQCNGNYYKQSCGNYDGDSCLEWSGNDYCNYGCSGGSCNSAPQNIACYSNSNCEADDWISGTETCSGGDVWAQYKTNTCVNPGTTSSYCSSSNSLQVKEPLCNYGC